MFDFKVENDRINLKINNKWTDILDIKVDANEFHLAVAEFNLLSTLCESRNFIAREVMHKNFICNAMINYVQMDIQEVLKSKIFKLITNIYIDSGPRTKRTIPYKLLSLCIVQAEEQRSSLE